MARIYYVIGAVQRYFESQRRNWRETTATDPGTQKRVAHQTLRRRIRSRQQRVWLDELNVFSMVTTKYTPAGVHSMSENGSSWWREGEVQMFIFGFYVTRVWSGTMQFTNHSGVQKVWILLWKYIQIVTDIIYAGLTEFMVHLDSRAHNAKKNILRSTLLNAKRGSFLIPWIQYLLKVLLPGLSPRIG